MRGRWLKRKQLVSAGLIAVVIFLAGQGVKAEALCLPDTVYIVRHAEKVLDPNNPDPPLAPEGKARAKELSVKLSAFSLNALYATQFKRTQQTLEPLAEASGLTVNVVKKSDIEGLVNRLTREHCGEKVLVAGHSDTVAVIIKALGVKETFSPHVSGYGDLFVIRYDGHKPRFSRERFGD